MTKLSIKQKREVLCCLATDAQMDDITHSEMFDLLMDGLPGYSKMTDQEVEDEFEYVGMTDQQALEYLESW